MNNIYPERIHLNEESVKLNPEQDHMDKLINVMFRIPDPKKRKTA